MYLRHPITHPLPDPLGPWVASICMKAPRFHSIRFSDLFYKRTCIQGLQRFAQTNKLQHTSNWYQMSPDKYLAKASDPPLIVTVLEATLLYKFPCLSMIIEYVITDQKISFKMAEEIPWHLMAPSESITSYYQGSRALHGKTSWLELALGAHYTEMNTICMWQLSEQACD